MKSFTLKTSHALLAAMMIAALPGSIAYAQVSDAVREYRRHMFDPEVSTLANRTFELMFHTARVEPADQVWQLPVKTSPLNFSYEADGTVIAAADFAERTFTDALLIMKGGSIVHEE